MDAKNAVLMFINFTPSVGRVKKNSSKHTKFHHFANTQSTNHIISLFFFGKRFCFGAMDIVGGYSLISSHSTATAAL